MSKRPSLLAVLTRWPWPVSTGRQRMLDQAVRFASEDYRVTLAVLSRRPLPDQCPPCVDRLFWLPMPGGAEVLWNFLKNPDRALQESLFMSRKARLVLARAIEEAQPDVVYFDMLRTAQYIHGMPPRECRRILDLDDLLSDRYAQMRTNGMSELMGAMGGAMPKAARMAASFLPKMLLSIEEQRMRRRELEVAKLFDAVLLTSPAEARKFSKSSGHPHVAASPPSVSTYPNRRGRWNRVLRFVFVGSDAFAPNAEALKVMDAVAGELVARGVEARFQSAGEASGRLSLSHVRQVGFVDDLSSFMGPDTVMLAPILTGTGVKTKVLEAMARGVPVVTTPEGIEGLDVVPGTHAVVAEGVSGLADACEALCRDQGMLARMSRAGQEYAAAVHGEETVRRNFLGLLGASEDELGDAA